MKTSRKRINGKIRVLVGKKKRIKEERPRPVKLQSHGTGGSTLTWELSFFMQYFMSPIAEERVKPSKRFRVAYTGVPHIAGKSPQRFEKKHRATYGSSHLPTPCLAEERKKMQTAEV